MHEWNKKPIGFVILFDTVFLETNCGGISCSSFFHVMEAFFAGTFVIGYFSPGTDPYLKRKGGMSK